MPFKPSPVTPVSEPETVTAAVVNVSEETKKQVSLETIEQGNTETRKQVSKEIKKQGNKQMKRYATYLPEDCIMAMQKIAFETRRKDYEVFLEAVEKYIKRHAE